MDVDAGVLSISGTGLGAAIIVSVDGQPVPVLAGATATHVKVLAPANMLIAPGTYRLTLVDPVRGGGDAFVVASHSNGAWSRVASGGVAGWRTDGAGPHGASVAAGLSALDRSAAVVPALLEDGVLRNTAVGFQALPQGSGRDNTATGYQALFSSAGEQNTGTGSRVLHCPRAAGDDRRSARPAGASGGVTGDSAARRPVGWIAGENVSSGFTFSKRG